MHLGNKKLTVVKTIPEHFMNIEIQSAQAFCKNQIEENPEYAEILCKQGITRTGLAEDGTVIGIMGIIFRHDNCAESWAIFSPYIKEYSYNIIKEVRNFLKEHNYIRRIFCTASVNFPEAHKLLTKGFGFKIESILEKWDYYGNDHIMYTIINRDLDWKTR